MDVECAWCGATMSSLSQDAQHPVSHGICPTCLEELFPVDTSLRHFLNTLPAPVAAVDATGKLVTANDLACSMMGRDADELRGLPGGDSFACAYARLPGGCGNTMHCRTCTIRLTVMATHETGEPQVNVEAYLDQMSGAETQRLAFRISTEKVKDVVLLRIDSVCAADG